MTRTQTSRRRTRGGLLALLVGFLTMALAACSGGAATPASSGPNPASPTKITVGVIPIVDTGAFRLGVSKGFFKELGLDVTVQDAQGGAAIVPAVMSGSNQIGFSNLSSVIIAKEKNLPVRVVAAGVATTGDKTKDFGGIVVKEGSSIASPKDLAGKTVAVNTLSNIGDTTVRHAVEAAGGDPSAVKFVEMAFPDMPGQLASGNVDAAWMVEPYVSIVKGQNGKVISYNLAEFDPNLQIGGFFTSTQYATANPGVVDAFKKGLAKSNEYATANPEELRTFLSTYTKIAPEVQKVVVLPKWPSSVDQAALQKLADEGQKYGMTKAKVEVKDIIG